MPVPVTTFSPIASGGVAQQPITSFNYENIGVNIDITPRTHHDDEVTLTLKVAVLPATTVCPTGCAVIDGGTRDAVATSATVWS